MDFLSTVTEVHPSLNDSVGAESKSISDATLSKLSKMVIQLKEEKSKRLERVILQRASCSYSSNPFCISVT